MTSSELPAWEPGLAMITPSAVPGVHGFLGHEPPSQARDDSQCRQRLGRGPVGVVRLGSGSRSDLGRRSVVWPCPPVPSPAPLSVKARASGSLRMGFWIRAAIPSGGTALLTPGFFPNAAQVSVTSTCRTRSLRTPTACSSSARLRRLDGWAAGGSIVLEPPPDEIQAALGRPGVWDMPAGLARLPHAQSEAVAIDLRYSVASLGAVLTHLGRHRAHGARCQRFVGRVQTLARHVCPRSRHTALTFAAARPAPAKEAASLRRARQADGTVRGPLARRPGTRGARSCRSPSGSSSGPTSASAPPAVLHSRRQTATPARPAPPRPQPRHRPRSSIHCVRRPCRLGPRRLRRC